MERRPILIIGAMDVEINFFLEQIQNLKENVIAGYHFYEGEIDSYPVIIAKSEIGVINAAVTTSLAIEKYNPLFIINQGTAGGIGNDIHTKDIVIGSEVLNIMSAKTPYKEIGETSNSTKWDYITFIEGKEDKKTTQKADEKLLSFFESCKYGKGKVHKGMIGSGDIWDREKDRMIYLNKEHKVLCEEMEGISVYTVANRYKIPVVGIRIISDNEILGEEYDRNLGALCQEFVYEGVKELIDNIEN